MATITRANVGVTISVGNAAVQTPEDVAALLRELAERVELRDWDRLESYGVALLDTNGNRVGGLQVTGFSQEDDGEE